MVKLAVFLTVIVACKLVDKVNSSNNFNIQNFLQALQQQIKSEQRQQLKSEQRQQQQKIYIIKNDDDGSYLGPLQHNNVEQIFRLLKSQNTAPKVRKNRYRHDGQPRQLHLQSYRVSPSDLLGLDNLAQEDRSSDDSDDREDDDVKNEYSKVYVVLNSEAIRKSKNKDKLNAFLSSLLSAPPEGRNNRYQIKQNRHRDRNDQSRDRLDRDDDRGDRYLKKRGLYQQKRGRYRDNRGKYQEQRIRNKNQRQRYQVKKEHRYQDRHNGNYHDDRGQEQRDWSDDDSDWYSSDQERYHQHEYDYRNRKRDRHYKEISRKMMASGEQYGKEGDMEARPPPRPREQRDKPRGRNRDRGGGVGGRTAIPYIRHHGDIYEKSDPYKK